VSGPPAPGAVAGGASQSDSPAGVAQRPDALAGGAPIPGALLRRASEVVEDTDLTRHRGLVSNLIGLIIETTGLEAEVGEVCLVTPGRGRPGGRNAPAPIEAEVVGFRDGRTLLMALGELHGIGPGTKVVATGAPSRVTVGEGLLGRVLDGLGAPLDGGPVPVGATRSTIALPPSPLSRPRIGERVGLGVRALDGLVPCGRGQRLGIFAGSGVGKSSLLGMIARSTSAQVNVIALVGERGREVREFVERDLGDALERSVVIVSTSDQPALVRIKAAFTATTIAEHFRDEGNDVLLMMDSVTRFAMAQREVGLAIGEPPATRGYTPSVFALLPRLLERAGTSTSGSITGLYTVLVDGDDMNEPVADAVRAILDGHVVLSRSLAHAGHYPAIDVLHSVSRLVDEIVSPEVVRAGQRLRGSLAVLREKEDLVAIGAYRDGTDPALDAALAHRAQIEGFLRQPVDSPSNPADTDARLVELAASLEGEHPDGEAIDARVTVDPPGHSAADVPSQPVSQPLESDSSAIPALGLTF
jgi:flagellum-specific ATP synthase